MQTNPQRISTNKGITYPELSYKLLGLLFKIQNKLGNTYQEKYYQRAIESELTKENIPFIREYEIKLNYEEYPIGKYYLDFVIDNKIALEIKTAPEINYSYKRQVLAYLASAGLKLGIIANFRTPKLTYCRLINPKYDSNH